MDLELTKALAAWGLESADAKLVRHYDNLVYKAKTENKTYALRICSPKTTQPQLKAEIDWLIALRRDTNLIVPKPTPNKQGNFISQLDDKYCVLYEWLEGEPVSQTMSSKVARQIGEMMATLHLHAADYSSDRQAVNCYDRHYFFGVNSWWQTKAKERLLDNYEKIIPAIEKAECLINRLSKSSEQFGMIHSDLHFSNIISDREKYAIIDFGDCGMGYYLMDLAVTEAEFKDYGDAKQLITVFRESYQNRRGCSPPSQDIRIFEVMSSLLWLEWIFESKSEQVREDKARWLNPIIQAIRETV